MKNNDYTKTHELMSERLKSESSFSEINSLDLSYGENDIDISLEMNDNNELIYRLQMDLTVDFVFLVDFEESISLEELVDTYISLGDFISGKIEHQGWGLGWGRLTWILINDKDINNRKMDINVAFIENLSGEYDGSEDYIKMSFGIDTVVELKQFIKESYEIISKKMGL